MTTARIVKAHAARDLATRAAFNFVDLRHEADSVIAQARREADELLAQARREVESLHEQTRLGAREEGLREAQSQIEQHAHQVASRQIDIQLETALPALHAAAEALQAERDRFAFDNAKLGSMLARIK